MKDEIIEDDPYKRTVSQFNDEYEEFKKQLDNVTLKNTFKTPKKTLDEFEKLLLYAKERLLVPSEYADNKIKELHSGINFPSNVRMSLSEKKQYIKDKAKKYFKKKK